MSGSAIRPNLFIVGAAKCGTTSMHTYLDQHPDVFMSAVKEPYYFGRDLDIEPRRRVKDESAYLRLFADAGEARCVGESSVWYLPSEQAAREIHEFNSDARIIIMLRHPADMMYSLHGQFLRSFNEDIVDFSEAIAAQADRREGRRIPNTAHFPSGLQYERLATFSPQVQRYMDAFSRERIKVILFDDLAADAAAVYRDVLGFLDLDPSFQPDLSAANVASTVYPRPLAKFLKRHPRFHAAFQRAAPLSWRIGVGKRIKRLRRPLDRPRSMSTDLRRRLQEQFAVEIERLGKLIERDLSHWCDTA